MRPLGFLASLWNLLLEMFLLENISISVQTLLSRFPSYGTDCGDDCEEFTSVPPFGDGKGDLEVSEHPAYRGLPGSLVFYCFVAHTGRTSVL